MSSHDSIFVSSLRAFCVAFFALFGFCVGIVVIVIVLSALIFSGVKEVEIPGNYSVLPNADGQKEALQPRSPLILHVDIAGLIGADELQTRDILEQLSRTQQAGLEGRVKGLFLYINTPGGSVFDADGIYRAIKAYREKYDVPVYVYVDGLCASGGMYIACAADQVYASSVSLVGSVGVIANFVNFSGTLDKIGVETLTIKQGIGKDALNPLRPWKEGEDEQMKKIISYYYEQFVDIVVTNRPEITRDQLIETIGARVFPAPQAKELGFIDGVVSSRDEVLKMLVEQADVADDYQVLRLDTKTWLNQLFQGSTTITDGEVVHKLQLPESLQEETVNGYLYLYRP